MVRGRCDDSFDGRLGWRMACRTHSSVSPDSGRSFSSDWRTGAMRTCGDRLCRTASVLALPTPVEVCMTALELAFDDSQSRDGQGIPGPDQTLPLSPSIERSSCLRCGRARSRRPKARPGPLRMPVPTGWVMWPQHWLANCRINCLFLPGRWALPFPRSGIRLRCGFVYMASSPSFVTCSPHIVLFCRLLLGSSIRHSVFRSRL